MKWVIFGILGWFGYSVIGSFSAPAFRDFDSATLKIALKDQKKVVVVEYYSDTWDPCVKLRESFEEIVDRYTDEAIIGKVDINKHPTFARSKLEGVRSIPYTQIYWKGKMVEDFIGFRSPNELRATILRHHGS